MTDLVPAKIPKINNLAPAKIPKINNLAPAKIPKINNLVPSFNPELAPVGYKAKKIFANFRKCTGCAFVGSPVCRSDRPCTRYERPDNCNVIFISKKRSTTTISTADLLNQITDEISGTDGLSVRLLSSGDIKITDKRGRKQVRVTMDIQLD